ncbi:MAG: cyclase family protein, partial [Patescibacteria group bacterium]
MKYIDLTHTFVDNMPVYPGDPVAEVKQIADIKKEGYTDHRITTGMHVGTHMDAPMHMIEGGKALSDMPVENFFGRGYLID